MIFNKRVVVALGLLFFCMPAYSLENQKVESMLEEYREKIEPLEKKIKTMLEEEKALIEKAVAISTQRLDQVEVLMGSLMQGKPEKDFRRDVLKDKRYFEEEVSIRQARLMHLIDKKDCLEDDLAIKRWGFDPRK